LDKERGLTVALSIFERRAPLEEHK
jgi:hypothetical protein